MTNRIDPVAANRRLLVRQAGGYLCNVNREPFVTRPRGRGDPLAVLGAREREVLALIAEGRFSAGIAQRLWVTEGTVEKHVRSILVKLNLPDAGW